MDMQRLVARMKEHEGFRPRVYDDATGRELRRGDIVRGVPTIGYGTTVVTEAQAEWIMRMTLLSLRDAIFAKYLWASELPADVLEVMVEMGYQLGIGGLGRFKNFLAALERRDYADAVEEMLASKWFSQTPKRVETLAAIIARHIPK